MLVEYALCVSQACLAATAAIVAILLLLRKGEHTLHIVTGGVYLALLFLFLPFHWGKEGLSVGHQLLFAAVDSLKVFWKGHSITKVLEFTEEVLGRNCVNYATVLFILAPVLTISNILSLFRSLMDRLRYAIYPGKNKYILSEMNEEAMAMAESIREKKPYTQIVFTGVGKTEKDWDAAMMARARKINAICLSQTLPRLAFRNPLQKKVIFLINRQEPQNVAHAAALIEKYKNTSQKMELYVYAPSPESKMVIDYMDKGERVLNEKFKTYLVENLLDVLNRQEKDDMKKALKILSKAPLESQFSVRCIDPVEQTVRGVLEKNYLQIHNQAKESKTVSITILGFGKHGLAVLKTAAWMFQLYGYQLEINVFDLDGTCRKRLLQEAPELLSDPRQKFTDEASHDIKFFGADCGIDCFSADFDAQVLDQFWDRLKKTQLAFVSMGDDSRNIAAAMHIRKLFLQKRIKEAMDEGKQTTEEIKKRFDICDDPEMPLICAVVTDLNRSKGLIRRKFPDTEEGRKEQGCYEYNILPVGNLKEVYDFDRIQELMELEKKALWFHLAWSMKDMQKKKKAEDFTAADMDTLAGKTRKYVQYSYFRDSSIAEASQQMQLMKIEEEYPELVKIMEANETENRVLLKLSESQKEQSKTPASEDEKGKEETPEEQKIRELRRITEHMRWNAYMRAQGYRQCDVRNDRAKLHNLMVRYHLLSEAQQDKDLAEFEQEG